MIIEDFEKRPTSANFLKVKEENIAALNFHFSEKIGNMGELYNILLEYSIPFFGDDDLLYISETKLDIDRIIFENNNSIISLIDSVLTLHTQKDFLAVRLLHRSIFEFLIVNNHLILTEDSDLVKKWIDNKDVKIVNNILKRTNNSRSRELTEFWVRLSKYSHAASGTSQSEFDWSYNYGHHSSNIFITYVLLFFYNFQLRELYFSYMQAVYASLSIPVDCPYKSDRFKKVDKIKEFERNKNQKLKDLLKAFTYKWELK